MLDEHGLLTAGSEFLPCCWSRAGEIEARSRWIDFAPPRHHDRGAGLLSEYLNASLLYRVLVFLVTCVHWPLMTGYLGGRYAGGVPFYSFPALVAILGESAP